MNQAAESLDLIAQELDDIRDMAVNGHQGLILAQQQYMRDSAESHRKTQEMIGELLRILERHDQEIENAHGRLAALERGQNVSKATQ